ASRSSANISSSTQARKASVTARLLRKRIREFASSLVKEIFHPGRTDEIVERKSAHVVGRIMQFATGVAHLEVRMVILDVGDPGDRVDEGHSAMEIVEAENLVYAAAVRGQRPSGQVLQVVANLRGRQGVFLALARDAMGAAQLVRFHAQFQRRISGLPV